MSAGKAAWAEATLEEQDNRREKGRQWWLSLTNIEVDAQVEARKEAWRGLNEDQQEEIIENLGIGSKALNERKKAEAAEKYVMEGDSVIVPDSNIWDCVGESCKFECAKKVNLVSLINISNYKILVWLSAHRLMDLKCNRQG